MAKARTATTCPKCSGAMEAGLLVDTTVDMSRDVFRRGRELPLQWIRGNPGKPWWSEAFRVDERDRLGVATLRCTGCGFVEMYANEPA